MVAIARFCSLLGFACAVVVASALPAQAQIVPTAPYSSISFIPDETPPASRNQDNAPLRTAAEEVPVPASAEEVVALNKTPRRVLNASYLGLGVLQTLDAHSTLRALDSGMQERNPLMRWASSHPAAFISLKGAATAGTILVAEKIRKKHPKRALAFMTAINAAYALVVVHNYRVGGTR